MANQTFEIRRKQTTPRPVGRLMDVDFLGHHSTIFSLHMSRESEQLLVWQTDIRATD